MLDEADTMFDRGFGPDIRKFIGPLKTRALKPDDQGFQTILVTATMTKVFSLTVKYITYTMIDRNLKLLFYYYLCLDRVFKVWLMRSLRESPICVHLLYTRKLPMLAMILSNYLVLKIS